MADLQVYEYPLDIEQMFIDWSLLKKGFRAVGIVDENKQQKIILSRHDNIYDFVGIKDAFIRSALEYAKKIPRADSAQRHLTKLERWMTAHLCTLYIYSEATNNDETPYMNRHTALYSENMSQGIHREGYVTTLLRASAIGEQILSMLPLNVNNIGGSL